MSPLLPRRRSRRSKGAQSRLPPPVPVLCPWRPLPQATTPPVASSALPRPQRRRTCRDAPPRSSSPRPPPPSPARVPSSAVRLACVYGEGGVAPATSVHLRATATPIPRGLRPTGNYAPISRPRCRRRLPVRRASAVEAASSPQRPSARARRSRPTHGVPVRGVLVPRAGPADFLTPVERDRLVRGQPAHSPSFFFIFCLVFREGFVLGGGHHDGREMCSNAKAR